jgi:hypothetical protein
MRYVINGTTGLLGRNLLFEILKQNLKNLDDIEIIILGKGFHGKSLEVRMNEIIFEDGFDYLDIDRSPDVFLFIKSRISYIEFDLGQPDLGISKENIKLLKSKRIDVFFIMPLY